MHEHWFGGRRRGTQRGDRAQLAIIASGKRMFHNTATILRMRWIECDAIALNHYGPILSGLMKNVLEYKFPLVR